MKKYYAVKLGKKPGIYNTWEECRRQVSGYSGAQYKSFTSLNEAKAFISMNSQIEEVLDQNALLIYVDGSFNSKTNEYGYGCVFIENQKVINEIYGKGSHEDYVAMRNVSGEIFGCQVAIEYAIAQGFSRAYIYYDYEGIEKWAIGAWKTNKVGTITYAKRIKEYQKQIQIQFVKVLAHSGDLYNERADQLAKKAIGITK